MIVAIDDTYGQKASTPSQYVTHERRTHVAVVFKDEDSKIVREELTSCLAYASELIGTEVSEFHFTDLYNKRGPWKNCKNSENLKFLETFAQFYRNHQWPVIVQTIDDRTLRDHKIEKFNTKIGKLDLTKREDLSLFFLLLKFKFQCESISEASQIIIDEGIGKAGSDLGLDVFYDWPHPVSVKFQSSSMEPLLQISDFIAFCINRSTHLALKGSRSDMDLAFLDMVGHMNINSTDLIKANLPINFDAKEFDSIHKIDRKQKGIE